MKIIDLLGSDDSPSLQSYSEVWELQRQLVQDRAESKIEDTLVLVEHSPVYTLGRGGFDSETPRHIQVKKLGAVPVIEVERGGKITFHGPGQIVGYPIFALPQRDLRMYLRDMERILVGVVSEHTDLPVKPCPESLLLEPGQLQTGVWVRDSKIASIGIAVKHWVTYHGFALNLSTDMRYFEAVEPCGFQASILSSVERELSRTGKPFDGKKLRQKIKTALISQFEALSLKYSAAQPSPASQKALEI